MRFRILPLLVIVAAMSFGVRFGDFVSGVSAIPGSANAQSAQENVEAQIGEIEIDNSTEDMAAQDTVIAATVEEPRTAGMEKDADPYMNNPPDWRDAADSDLEYSSMRMELFEDLSARRKALEQKERELSVREALLKAAEQEIDQKYRELVSLRSEIQDLLVVQSDEEQQRVASLVKIYEGMKPKDAARIFNTLDMDVMLNVVSQMSERKSAPIIASMEPDRARALTMMLMEQKSLPTIQDDNLLGGFNS